VDHQAVSCHPTASRTVRTLLYTGREALYLLPCPDAMHALPVQVDVLRGGGDRMESCMLPIPQDALIGDILNIVSATPGGS
jgi:hypothetical protein